MNKYLCTNDVLQDLCGLQPIKIDAIAELIKGKRWLACDTETSGLSPIDNVVTMLQIYDGQNVYVIDCQTVDCQPLKETFESLDTTTIWHNAKFDVKFLKQLDIHPEKVYDTMLADKVIHCGKNMRFGLKDLILRYLDIVMEKEVRASFIGHTGTFNKAQLTYGIEDVVHLITIVKKQKALIDKYNVQPVIDLENQAVLAFADIEYNGLYLDKEVWSGIASKVGTKVDKLMYDMDMDLLHRFPEYKDMQLKMFSIGRPVTINWDSQQQVLACFQKIYKNIESVGADVLKTLKNPLVQKFVQYKELTKLTNAYGEDFYKYLHGDGRVHTNFSQVLYTGRVSSSSPNMQQIPADNTYRNAFGCSDPDWVMVSSDFSAQELCIIAYGSKDPVWLDVLANGGDLHSRCASLVFGDAWNNLGSTDDERKNTEEGGKYRKMVKTVSFGLCYGMQAGGLSRTLDIPKKEAKNLIKRYFQVFPRIKNFLDMAAGYGVDNGFIKTFKPFGRVRHFENWAWEMDFETKSQIERWSMNTPIQGSAADQTKLALINLRRWLKDNPHIRAKVVCTVHDQIDMEAHKDDAKIVGDNLSRIMAEAANVNCPGDLIKCDVTITKNWTK